MKRFVDDKGTFEIKVPITWKYSLSNDRVHTFQEYEMWKSDTFQFSINPLDTSEKTNNFQQLIKTLSVEKIGNEVFHRFPNSSDNQFTLNAWVKQFGGKSVLFSFTHPSNPDEDLENRSVEEKIAAVHKILNGFRLISDEKNTEVLNSYRFDMFLQGFGATALILNKSVENKAFIESTCILANQIDALLRVGIILKTQTNNKNSHIAIEWIYQGLNDKKKSEKDIYKKALEIGIIDTPMFDKLYTLYDHRNRVIHRFIISEITLAEVEEIAYSYYQQQQAISNLIYELESEQIKLNIGMTTFGKNDNEDDDYLEYIKGKIGKLNYFDQKV